MINQESANSNQYMLYNVRLGNSEKRFSEQVMHQKIKVTILCQHLSGKEKQRWITEITTLQRGKPFH